MKNRIMLVMPPHNSDLSSFKKPVWSICRIPPIGLLSIASYLHENGQDVFLIDCREIISNYKTNNYLAHLISDITVYKPDIIGINFLTANFNHVKMISDAIKEYFPSINVVVGGVHPSVEPDLTFKQIQSIDAICVGAGEEVTLKLAQGYDLNKIEGLQCRNNSLVKSELVTDIDKYPYLNFDLVNQDWYTYFSTYTITGFGFKGISALTSISCPNNCYFCSSDWSKPFRYHSSKYVIGLAKSLSKLDVDVISFFDDTMGLKEDRLVEICEGFINEKLFHPHTNLRWVGELRANQCKPEILSLMKRAGCFHIGMGIESGSDRMLKVINKRVTVEENRQACYKVKEAGLHLGISFMMGIPGETELDMRQTLSFMKEINCNYMGIGNFRPLPGSRFFNELVKDKENIDWVNLGNFMVVPKYKFYDCDDGMFNKLYDEAYNFAYGRQWLAMHGDTFKKYSIAKDISSKIKTKVCHDNYYSDFHKSVKASLLSSMRSIFEKIYMVLPYSMRVFLKTRIKKVANIKFMSKLLWRYS